MRAQSTSGKSIPRRTRNIAMRFAVALVTSIAMLNSPSQLQATPPGDVTIIYLNATSMGSGEWYVDGIVQGSDLSAVTITMGGAAASVGTLAPDEFGYFYFDVAATPFELVTAQASDGAANSQADVVLYSFFSP